MYICKYVYMHKCIYVYMYIGKNVYMYIIYVYMYICIYVQMYICKEYIYTYMYISLYIIVLAKCKCILVCLSFPPSVRPSVCLKPVCNLSVCMYVCMHVGRLVCRYLGR